MSPTYFSSIDVSKLSINGVNVSVDKPYVPLELSVTGVITLPNGLTAQGVTAFTSQGFFALADVAAVVRPGTVSQLYKLADIAKSFIITKDGVEITNAVQPARNSYFIQDNHDLASGTHNQLSLLPLKLKAEAGSTAGYFVSHTHGIISEFYEEIAPDFSNIVDWWSVANIKSYLGMGRFVTDSPTYSWLNNFKGVDRVVATDISTLSSGYISATWAYFDLPPTAGVNWDDYIYEMPLLNTFKQTA